MFVALPKRPVGRFLRTRVSPRQLGHDQRVLFVQREQCHSTRSDPNTLSRAPTKGKASKSYGLVASASALVGLGLYLAGRASVTVPEPDVKSTLALVDAHFPESKGSIKDVQAVWNQLADVVGEDNVTNMEGELEFHSTSGWSTHEWNPEHQPVCVVFPKSTEEVSSIMKICHASRIPVTGFSGGTSLEGQYSPTYRGVTIDFGRMNKIIDIHDADLDAVVQPAVGWQDLNEQLAKRGLFFPPDPGPGARIGGMIGTSCSGTNAYRYGTMRDWVVNLTVVMADGTVIKTRRRPRKSSAGYNLTQMFVGSEGTLGLVTEATVKLTPLPQSTSVAVCSFGTIKQAAECVAGIVGQGIALGAIEIMDGEQMRFINRARGPEETPCREEPTLFLKFGGTPDGVKEQLRIVEALAKKAGSQSFELARTKAEESALWSARKDALWATMNEMEEGDRLVTTDVAVPISRLPEIIELTQKDLKELGITGSILGHAGDGNFHTIVFTNPDRKTEAKEFVNRMVKRALDMEGTCTGEHGVGLIKRAALVDEVGEDTIAAMRRLKQAFDPLCLLNCDKVFLSRKPTTSAHTKA